MYVWCVCVVCVCVYKCISNCLRSHIDAALAKQVRKPF